MQPLPRSFYQHTTEYVARLLLGKYLVYQHGNQLFTGIIVETEAYGHIDPACHAYKGHTQRTTALFGPVGHAYIYQSYGIHWCLNVVARDEKSLAGGVLIRALEPIEGIEAMKHNRNMQVVKQLTNGPGKLTQALGITKKLYGVDMTKKGELYITEGQSVLPDQIVATTRIGISVATDVLWRFHIKDNPFVSR